MKKIIGFALLFGAAAGAAVAALSEGAFGPGWLAAGGLTGAACLVLGLAWRWAGGGRKLAVLMAAAFGLRLAMGIIMSLGIQAFGYNEPVQRAGYVYADAFTRDQDAWTLAQSDKPLWASFQKDFLSDQYGGSLALSALIYRAISPDAHRRFLILILTAFVFSAGLPFFWRAVKKRWDEPLAQLSTWLLVLYPESILVGASQMREPFLLGLSMIAFWAVFNFRRRRRLSTLIFAAAGLGMLAFSSRAAVVILGALLVCAWLEYVDEIINRSWKWLGGAGLAAAALILLIFSWSWVKTASAYDASLTVRDSGMVQMILRNIPEALGAPFVITYGLAQPVLPAVLADSAPLVWKTIGTLRALGWYGLAPFLLYAIFVCWQARPEKERRLLLWWAFSSLLWLLLCSARAGGDQWDNPRYRVLFLPFMALLTAWGWQWSRARRDAWVWAWVGTDFLFVTVFLSWYNGRSTLDKLPFWTSALLILTGSAILLAAGWVWNLLRRRRSVRAELSTALHATRTFFTLQPVEGFSAAAPHLPARIDRHDVWVVLFFVGFAALYFLGRLQDNFPLLILSGDAGNITSFAAAQARPELFIGDPVLGENGLTGFYAAVQIPIIKALAPLANGDFAWAYTWLVGPHVFFQLLGFYILGRQLLRSRFWALIFALLTAMPFLDVGVGEMWGIWRDALPRITFQTVLPYLLALVVAWRGQPRRWPWLMIAAGLMVFLHSVSTPAWGLAIWLGLWVYHPLEWKWPKRLGVMFALGLLFLLALSPFALNFLSYQARGASPDTDLVNYVIRTYLPENLLNIPAAFAQFLLAASRSLLLPLALLGGFLLWRFGRPERRLLGMVLLWGAGLFLAAVALPFGERQVEAALRIAPVDTELVRALRYFVPWLLIFWVWPLAELTPRLANPRARQAALLSGILLLAGWSATHTPEARKMLEALTCLTQCQWVCVGPRDSADFIVALRSQTPPGARIFNFNQDDRSTSNALSIRYQALRPMVYTVRDAGLFIYANRSAFKDWLNATQQVDGIQALADPAQRIDHLVPLAQAFHADYLTFDFPLDGADLNRYPVDLVWQNKTYTLLRLR